MCRSALAGPGHVDRAVATAVDATADWGRRSVHERDIAHSQFPWTFQRYLYDCMHDYLVEMFLVTPQNREMRP